MIEKPEQTTLICLVRHGQTDWNAEGRIQGETDVPLNAIGREQARRCGAALAQEHQPWDLIVSSPLKRAWQTAEILEEFIGPHVIVPEPDFVERHYGAAEGKTRDEVDAAFPDGNVPGREPRVTLRQRSMAALARHVAAHPGRRLVVVAHGGVINAILTVITEGEMGTGKTRLMNAGYCLATHNEKTDEWAVLACNVVGHLED